MLKGAIRRGDAARTTPPEEQDRANEVGEVESADGERYDVVEGIGRRNIDKAKKTGYCRCEDYRSGGNGSTRIHLVFRNISRVFLHHSFENARLLLLKKENRERKYAETILTLLRIRQPGRP